MTVNAAMDGRADTFYRAFDGASIDWAAMLGSGIGDLPKDHVSVYREVSLEELVRIAREGLSVPHPETRHPDMREEMELLDRYRPQHIIAKGISRLGAIYACPTEETPKFPFRRERFILEVKVDPKEAFVGDMDFITCLIPFIGANRMGLQRYKGAFTKYWESVISLADFKKWYRQVETDDGVQWMRAAGAPKRLEGQRVFFAPEILVMTPVISPRHVRVVRRERTEHECVEREELRMGQQLTWEDER